MNQLKLWNFERAQQRYSSRTCLPNHFRRPWTLSRTPKTPSPTIWNHYQPTVMWRISFFTRPTWTWSIFKIASEYQVLTYHTSKNDTIIQQLKENYEQRTGLIEQPKLTMTKTFSTETMTGSLTASMGPFEGDSPLLRLSSLSELQDTLMASVPEICVRARGHSTPFLDYNVSIPLENKFIKSSPRWVGKPSNTFTDLITRCGILFTQDCFTNMTLKWITGQSDSPSTSVNPPSSSALSWLTFFGYSFVSASFS